MINAANSAPPIQSHFLLSRIGDEAAWAGSETGRKGYPHCWQKRASGRRCRAPQLGHCVIAEVLGTQ